MKLDKKSFIDRAVSKWGDCFDYSKSEYINSITPIVITCKKHGDFIQKPCNHLRSKGCPDCIKRHFYTTDSFISKSNEIHNRKYDYSKTIFKSTRDEVIITCPIHGDFKQTANAHLRGFGCDKCKHDKAFNSTLKSRRDKFIDNSLRIHGDRYDYSHVDYKNNVTPVEIICKIHGSFWQTPRDHINGCGCKLCSRSIDKRKLDFISKAIDIYGDLYDYSNVEYFNNSTPVEIICKLHGSFFQKPNIHLSGHGCRKCANSHLSEIKKKSFEDWINDFNKVHFSKYDYSLNNDIKANDKISIICSKHGVFYQKANFHLYGGRCPKCAMESNRLENELYDFVNSHIVSERCVRGVLGVGLEIDVYIEQLNIGFEFNGLYWHSDTFRNKYNLLHKRDLFENVGIKIFHIFEDEWIYKKDVVKHNILNIIGIYEIEYNVLDLDIRDVDVDLEKVFLVENDIYGYSLSSHRFGLFYGEDLVCIMTFKGINTYGEYEIIRFCSKVGVHVIDGYGFILEYFINNFNVSKISSYIDLRWDFGDWHKKMGFREALREEPSFFYIKGQKRFVHDYSKDYSMLPKIYDCGRVKYEMNIE